MKLNCYDKDKIIKKLKTAKEAFKSFGEFELKGREYIRNAITSCYDIVLHYNEKVIKKRCKKANIKYSASKPEKMILMLAMNVQSDCDDERTKARIRTYSRVLKRFDELEYDVEKAKEELDKFGIDYFANPRSNNYEDEEDSEKQLAFGFIDGASEENDDFDDDNEEEIEDEDEQVEENHQHSSSKAKTSLEAKIVKFLKKDIDDKNYVIWVNNGKVLKSTDVDLLKTLNDFEFLKLP